MTAFPALQTQAAPTPRPVDVRESVVVQPTSSVRSPGDATWICRLWSLRPACSTLFRTTLDKLFRRVRPRISHRLGLFDQFAPGACHAFVGDAIEDAHGAVGVAANEVEA